MEVEVTWSVGTSTAAESGIQVWPNPAINWLFVRPSTNMPAFRFWVMNGQGTIVRDILKDQNGEFTVPVDELPSGVYM